MDRLAKAQAAAEAAAKQEVAAKEALVQANATIDQAVAAKEELQAALDQAAIETQQAFVDAKAAAAELDAKRPLAELVEAATPGPWYAGNGTIEDEKGNVLFSVTNATAEDVKVLVRLCQGLDAYRASGDLDAFKAWVVGLT